MKKRGELQGDLPPVRKIMTVRIGENRYGFDIRRVQEIVTGKPFNPLPGERRLIRGFINYRDQVVPLVDLRFFPNGADSFEEENEEPDVEKEPEDREHTFIVLDHEGREKIALAVNEAGKISDTASGEIKEIPPWAAGLYPRCICGIFRQEAEFCLLTDVSRIFSVLSDSFFRGKKEKKRRRSSLFDAADFLKKKEGFHLSPVNEDWLVARLKQLRENPALLFSCDSSRTVLESFFSIRSTGLWDSPRRRALGALISGTKVIRVWNPGCGEGAESCSVWAGLKEAFPDSLVRVFASDRDLPSVLKASDLSFESDSVPEGYGAFGDDDGRGRFTFRHRGPGRAVSFEYDDLTALTPEGIFDLAVMRDILSFLPEERHEPVFRYLEQSTRPGASVLILGDNENLKHPSWKREPNRFFNAYRRV